MANPQVQNQVKSMRETLIEQGYLDEQFVQLEELQDDSSPNFVEEVVTMFFVDCARRLNEIEKDMEKSPINFEMLDTWMHQIKGSSVSVGAIKVKEESIMFRDFCQKQNEEGCKMAFKRLQNEFEILQRKLETYFQLARQAGMVGPSSGLH